MVDTITSEHRSWVMSRIRSGDTTPERVVRSLLHRLGYRFSLHRKDLPGTPDIVLRKHKTVVFVHGCFWHRHPGCKQSTTPKTRKEFWRDKFERNVARDERNQCELRKKGWNVIVVWECKIKADPVGAVLDIVRRFDPERQGGVSYGDLPDGRECLKVAEEKLHYALGRKS